jgi:hypothetical protein
MENQSSIKKFHVFLWHLARQSIPTGDVRHHRNMALDGNYTLCGGSDSWKHALLECNLAKCVRALERKELTGFICQIETLDARAWLAEVMAINTCLAGLGTSLLTL